MPITPANSAVNVRSLIDSPDDFSGYQIHLVYVSTRSSIDSKWDTEGKIHSWIQESQDWLDKQIGRKLLYDTYQGKADVTYLSSKYSREELCRMKCDGLGKLEKEYVLQNPLYNGSKTVVFVLNEDLEKDACGWADSPGNFALLSLGSPECGDGRNDFKTYGISWPAKSLLHELFHTYGIDHKCSDNSDLMIGSPECGNKRAFKLVTLDSKKNQYIGSESSDGIDLLKMPIWQKKAGVDSYSKISAASKDRYVPKLRDGKVYAVVGDKSRAFQWEWGRNLYPSGLEVSCELISDLSSIVGVVEDSSCFFDVPGSLRAGKVFTVTQKWTKGPWYGQESISGVFVRSNFNSDLCTLNTCLVGQTTIAQYSCWESKIKTMILQQLISGQWNDISTVPTESGVKCKSDSRYSHYPVSKIEFKKIGYFIYRWLVPAQSGYSSYSDEPFAIVVNEEQSPEPSELVIEMAKRKAIELGKSADLANKQGGKAALDSVAEQQAQASIAITNQLLLDLRKIQDSESANAAELKAKQEAEAKARAELKTKLEEEARAAALKTKTIVCVKGKLTKKVTAVKPKCPTGYKVKR